MATSNDRILTTHVGSLVRPPELTKYIEAIDNGVKIDQAAFDRCLADSVAEVVRRQQQAGVDIVSDGEFGKFRSWSFYVLDRLAGIEEQAIETAARRRSRSAIISRLLRRVFPDAEAAEAGHGGLRRPDRLQRPGGGSERHRHLQGRVERCRLLPTLSCQSSRPRAPFLALKMNTTRTMRSFCSNSLKPCAKNTKRLSMPD